MDRQELPLDNSKLRPQSEVSNHIDRCSTGDRNSTAKSLRGMQTVRRHLPSKGFHRYSMESVRAKGSALQSPALQGLYGPTCRATRRGHLRTMRVCMPLWKQNENQVTSVCRFRFLKKQPVVPTLSLSVHRTFHHKFKNVKRPSSTHYFKEWVMI